ncbi:MULTISPECIES: hypothetical protein [Oligella]|uniref:Uncharacterized protein n=2 Tax=Oligella urethralis TaxID=90245 RepID=A0A095Z8K3_9BURK|nr:MULTISPECIES: hypothetical protein [Oligella]AVL70679.1 hypothetical protein CEQ07_04095 [Oligella urethralis]KGF31070.1 hypothetical protein HMPREF2130_04600 [Oligella urethralis DNF00040]OFS82453.1 hypothetical protein HMPREF3144_10920 [Oligella sp. HMSC05A10]OFV51376.1 hypothetical protein HMPREF3179_00860 [Oligella sp. HMSC09E12]PMC16979.1 hypothetical protein CJ230_07425 [Oligella urethralis]
MNQVKNHTIENWGYEHPDVKGPNALMFFTWDLSKTIENAFQDADESNLEAYVQQAQASVDRLLSRYVEIGADPQVFEGQYINLTIEQRPDSNSALIALETSPELEAKIIAMQARIQPGHS